MRLRHSDWKKLFAAIAELHSDIDPTTLGSRAMGAFKCVLSGELTAFDFFYNNGVHSGDFWTDPPNAISESENDIFSNVAHGHPFFSSVFGEGRRDAMTTNEFLTTTQFHQSAVYNEYYRIFRIDHQLTLPIGVAPDVIVTCTQNRVRGDFTDEERQMIDLFAPHLKNAIVNGRKIGGLFAAERGLNEALTGKSTGVLSMGTNGRVLYFSTLSGTLLHAYYGDADVRADGIPNRFLTWIENCEKMRRLDPMISESKIKLDKHDAYLNITLIFDDNKREKLVIIEEIRKSSPISLLPLGLTNRQTEVLFWVSQGKTDKDIAELLSISPRTVHKHLENIYIALGVETRTAAMQAAMTALNFTK